MPFHSKNRRPTCQELTYTYLHIHVLSHWISSHLCPANMKENQRDIHTYCKHISILWSSLNISCMSRPAFWIYRYPCILCIRHPRLTENCCHVLRSIFPAAMHVMPMLMMLMFRDQLLLPVSLAYSLRLTSDSLRACGLSESVSKSQPDSLTI